MSKRDRTRLARAELWLHLAMTAERWARYCEDAEPGVIPFAEYPADDPLVTLCRTYDLSPQDLARAARSVAQQAENRAIRGGYEEAWTDPAEQATA